MHNAVAAPRAAGCSGAALDAFRDEIASCEQCMRNCIAAGAVLSSRTAII